VLSCLTLVGDFKVEVPIVLPPLFILALRRATLTVDPTFVGDGVITVSNYKFSSVVSPDPSSGVIKCPLHGPSPRGIFATQASYFTVDGVTVDGCGWDDDGTSAVEFYGDPSVSNVQISNCVITNSWRAVWFLVASRGFVFNNVITNASKHTIDIDAYSSYVLVFNNTVSGSAQVRTINNTEPIGHARNLAPGLRHPPCLII
jgi:hypothetical protein